jgi:undecaprenyl diphosphate synthase
MKALLKTRIKLLVGLGLFFLVIVLFNKRYLFFGTEKGSNIQTGSLKDLIVLDKLPQHVAVMMDGNGRWAAKQGKPRVFGHMSSLQSVEETITACVELNIPYLTLFAFSTENWGRPREEVNTLMQLFVATIRDKLQKLMENNIKLQVIGDISRLPQECQIALDNAIQATKDNKGLRVIVALSYSGKWDIIQAAKTLAHEVQIRKVKPEDINAEIFQHYLSTSEIPDPDVLIRTGGDIRISNFLLWQLAYTELVFVEKYWPEFRKEDFYKALINYQQRDRRFGKITYKP